MIKICVVVNHFIKRKKVFNVRLFLVIKKMTFFLGQTKTKKEWCHINCDTGVLALKG